MSLMRLLTVGRSLGNATPRPNRYKLPEQNALPKLGPVRPPVEPAPLPAPVTPPAAASGTPRLETGSLFEFSAESRVGARGPQEERAVSPLVSPAAAVVANPFAGEVVEQKSEEVLIPMPDRPGQPAKKTWSLVNMLFLRRKKESSAARVQGEWSLEKVTVVRNDLSDADLEVVAAKKKKAPEVKAETDGVGEKFARFTSRFQKGEAVEVPVEAGATPPSPVGQPGTELAARF